MNNGSKLHPLFWEAFPILGNSSSIFPILGKPSVYKAFQRMFLTIFSKDFFFPPKIYCILLGFKASLNRLNTSSQGRHYL